MPAEYTERDFTETLARSKVVTADGMPFSLCRDVLVSTVTIYGSALRWRHLWQSFVSLSQGTRGPGRTNATVAGDQNGEVNYSFSLRLEG